MSLRRNMNQQIFGSPQMKYGRYRIYAFLLYIAVIPEKAEEGDVFENSASETMGEI